MGISLGCLRNLRLEQALTQRELARRSGLSVSTICKVEQGEPVASIRVIHQLAAGLNVPIAALLQDELAQDRHQFTIWR